MALIATDIDFLRRGGRKTVVRVDAGVTLAMHWLIPRLAHFAQEQPGAEVELNTSDGPIDTTRPTDVHIRRDASEFRGREPVWFLEEYSVLVARRGRVDAGQEAVHRLEPHGVRIGARSRTDLWPQWSRHHGLPEADWLPTLEFDNTVLAIQAAAEGLGSLVVPEMFIGQMLDSQLLVQLGSARVPSGAYAYVTGPGRVAGAVRKFTDWLDRFKA